MHQKFCIYTELHSVNSAVPSDITVCVHAWFKNFAFLNWCHLFSWCRPLSFSVEVSQGSLGEVSCPLQKRSCVEGEAYLQNSLHFFLFYSPVKCPTASLTSLRCYWRCFFPPALAGMTCSHADVAMASCSRVRQQEGILKSTLPPVKRCKDSSQQAPFVWK